MNFEFGQQSLVVADIGTRGGVPWWKLVRPLCFRANCGVSIEVPQGFETDFASVPRWLWGLFPPHGIYSRAAVVHDYLYRQTTVSRFLADAVFREAMAQLGVPTWRRVAMYYAVRLFGAKHRRR